MQVCTVRMDTTPEEDAHIFGKAFDLTFGGRLYESKESGATYIDLPKVSTVFTIPDASFNFEELETIHMDT